MPTITVVYVPPRGGGDWSRGKAKHAFAPDTPKKKGRKEGLVRTPQHGPLYQPKKKI